MTMRCYHRTCGEHVHVRMFMDGALLGHFVCLAEDFDTVRLAMRGFHFRAEPEKTAEELDEDNYVFDRLLGPRW
ncbi:hypothetical protein I6F26_10360 [Ensifer sp. IC3342]|nr:hypothetical protein [Ensifer sp. BRP08]MCA1446981.1 hypothetical protein [Ensifer sp. IC3342]